MFSEFNFKKVKKNILFIITLSKWSKKDFDLRREGLFPNEKLKIVL